MIPDYPKSHWAIFDLAVEDLKVIVKTITDCSKPSKEINFVMFRNGTVAIVAPDPTEDIPLPVDEFDGTGLTADAKLTWDIQAGLSKAIRQAWAMLMKLGIPNEATLVARPAGTRDAKSRWPFHVYAEGQDFIFNIAYKRFDPEVITRTEILNAAARLGGLMRRCDLEEPGVVAVFECREGKITQYGYNSSGKFEPVAE